MYQLRQLGFLRPELWDETTVHVLGCGGLGSPLALILAKMGAKTIALYDKDTVEDVNINNQLFGPKDIGKNKVEAVKENIQALSGIENVLTFHGNILSQKIELSDKDIVVLSLDSNDTRKAVYKTLIAERFKGLVLDPRMAGLIFSVYASVGKDILSYKKFTPDDDVVPDSVCTEKAIAFNTFGCSSIGAEICRKFLRREIKKPLRYQMDFHNIYLTEIPN